jgi:AraC family transcriptional regulator, transcriptional activator of pobA
VPGLVPVGAEHLPEHFPLRSPAWAHSHDFVVLFYAHRADGTFRLDDREWAVRDGDLFVIAPGQVVSFTGPTHEFLQDGWAVFFPAEVIRPHTPGAPSTWQAHPLLFPFARGTDRAQRLHVPPGERPEWLARCRALATELTTRRDGYAEAVLAHLTLLLVAAARLPTDVPDELRAAREPLLAAVFDVIERRYAEPISLSDIAADLALTTGHLTTVVRRRTGRTVGQWLTERRMRQARLLLTNTDLTVAAISHRVGYRDVSYFIKRFRTLHGHTPAEWRTA